MSSRKFKHTHGKEPINKKNKDTFPVRSKKVKKGKHYEKKRGPHYRNLLLHSILKTLEDQRHEYEKNRERAMIQQELENEKKYVKKFNKQVGKDKGLDRDAHDKITDILKARILIGDGNQAESGYQGISDVHDVPDVPDEDLDPTLAYLRDRLKKGRYTELYDQKDYDAIMNSIEGNNIDGVPYSLEMAASIEPIVRDEIRHHEYVTPAVFNSILADINSGSGIMDDDYNPGQVGIPGYQYLHGRGAYYQHGGNPYIEFLKNHKGQGYSRSELVSMYRNQQ